MVLDFLNFQLPICKKTTWSQKPIFIYLFLFSTCSRISTDVNMTSRTQILIFSWLWIFQWHILEWYLAKCQCFCLSHLFTCLKYLNSQEENQNVITNKKLIQPKGKFRVAKENVHLLIFLLRKLQESVNYWVMRLSSFL